MLTSKSSVKASRIRRGYARRRPGVNEPDT